MAEADIAYVATAGAAGLALALSAWAARLRARLAERNTALEAAMQKAGLDLSARDGALAAFEDVRVALTPGGGADRLGSPATWELIVRDLTKGAEVFPDDPAYVVLDAVRGVAGPRLDEIGRASCRERV